MIVITNIEMIEVNDREFFELQKYTEQQVGVKGSAKCFNISFEHVHGTVFRTPDGQQITVGISKQAEEILDIGYRCFRDQNERITELESVVKCYQKHEKNYRAGIKLLEVEIKEKELAHYLRYGSFE